MTATEQVLDLCRPKSLIEQFNEKALSLMSQRIKLLDHPGSCKTGQVIGVGYFDDALDRPYLKVVLDDQTTINLPVSCYLETFKYEWHDEMPIKATLSDAARSVVIIPRKYTEMFEGFDVIGNDRNFIAASRVSPDYVSWEMIKSADYVSVLHKDVDVMGESQYLVEAQTPRGLYRFHVSLDHLKPIDINIADLQHSPGSAIAVANDLIQTWFRTIDSRIENKVFVELNDDEIDSHYLVGSVDAQHRNNDDEVDHCVFLDDKGKWSMGYAHAIAIPYDHAFEWQQQSSPEEVLGAFLEGFVKRSRDLLIVPASHFASEPEQRMC